MDAQQQVAGCTSAAPFFSLSGKSDNRTFSYPAGDLDLEVSGGRLGLAGSIKFVGLQGNGFVGTAGDFPQSDR